MNVSHAVTSDSLLSYLNTTLIADDTLIFDLLILSAMAFPVLTWSEDLLTEQAVIFRL